VLQMIEEDIIRTLPTLQIFHPEHGPLYQDLKDILLLSNILIHGSLCGH